MPAFGTTHGPASGAPAPAQPRDGSTLNVRKRHSWARPGRRPAARMARLTPQRARGPHCGCGMGSGRAGLGLRRRSFSEAILR